jgi:hypothetical protein
MYGYFSSFYRAVVADRTAKQKAKGSAVIVSPE